METSLFSMENIKVLRIIARLNIGGPAIQTVLLTCDLKQRGFETVLVCGRPEKNEGDMSYYAKDKQVLPVIINELQREPSFLKDLISVVKVYRFIRKFRPRIIHTHTAKAGSVGRAAAILFNLFAPKDGKVKIIHTMHGHIFDGYFNRLKSALFLCIEKFFAIFSDNIITVSESIKNELVGLNLCKAGKIKVIPLGFELDSLLNMSSRNSYNHEINIGIVGRLVPIKNHRMFIDALNLLSKEDIIKSLKFYVIGDGELRQELENYALRLGLGEYVIFKGWQRSIRGIYSDLDIVVLTSNNEGTPVSLIEAMAAERPVVSSLVGGTSDLLGAVQSVNAGGFSIHERGIGVPAGNSSALAMSLKYLAENPSLAGKLSVNAREFASKKYNKKRLLDDIEHLYRNL